MSVTKGLAVGALVFAMTLSQAFAKPSDEDIAGAIALLGIAALAHNEHHYREGQAPSGAQDTALFERGFRDGLHGFEYDMSKSSQAYGQGYEAGMAERGNRNQHRTRAETAGPKVPNEAVRVCVAAIASEFGVAEHHAHVTRTVYREKDDYLVEVSVGHKYKNCAMGDGGAFRSMVDGRIN